MKRILRFTMIFATALMLAASCEKEPEVPGTSSSSAQEKEDIKKLIESDEDYDAKVSLLEMWGDGGAGFTPLYYWYQQVKSRNATLKPYDYGSIYNWFDALLYFEDRWSWMMDKSTYVSGETGTVSSSGTWGVSLTQPTKFKDYRVFINIIYPGSPFEQFGVTRGAQITGIGDIDISEGFATKDKSEEEKIRVERLLAKFNEYYLCSPMNFTFRLADGRDTSFTAEMTTSLKTNYILKTDIFTGEDFPGLTEPVGYFHYLEFQKNFLDAVRGEMAKFKEAGVRKMIVDLRYNGGGDGAASDLLMGYLAPAEAAGKSYCIREHNDLASDYNVEEIIPKGLSLGLDEVFFIMYEGSASASEMVYNGLRPYLKDRVHHVGGQSYGKPNGMYVFLYPTDDNTYNRVNAGDYSTLKYVFLPICFYNVNSDGEYIPSTAKAGSGFVPDYASFDDPYHDFNAQEANIKACLNHIVKGTYESDDDEDSPATKAVVSRNGIEVFKSEVETNLNYGRYVVPLPEKFRKDNPQK